MDVTLCFIYSQDVPRMFVGFCADVARLGSVNISIISFSVFKNKGPIIPEGYSVLF